MPMSRLEENEWVVSTRCRHSNLHKAAVQLSYGQLVPWRAGVHYSVESHIRFHSQLLIGGHTRKWLNANGNGRFKTFELSLPLKDRDFHVVKPRPQNPSIDLAIICSAKVSA